MSNRLWIRPGGGLGNQLHLYMAGQLASIIRGKELHVDLSGLNLTPHGQNSSIFDFDLEGSFHFKSRNERLRLFKNRLSNNSEFFSRQLKIFSDSSLGFNEALLNADIDISYLEGFFHTHIYADLLRASFPLVALKKNIPSIWFGQLAEEIQETNSVALHVRRGDYVSSWRHYGILSADYYLNAAKRISPNLPNPRFFVFSDSPLEAKAMFKGTFLEKAEFISPPLNARASESMVLMSKAKSLVIANSSFSWWSAYMADFSAMKIFPEPFFRKNIRIKELTPKSWLPNASSWVDY